MVRHSLELYYMGFWKDTDERFRDHILLIGRFFILNIIFVSIVEISLNM